MRQSQFTKRFIVYKLITTHYDHSTTTLLHNEPHDNARWQQPHQMLSVKHQKTDFSHRDFFPVIFVLL